MRFKIGTKTSTIILQWCQVLKFFDTAILAQTFCLLDGNWYAIRPLYIHNVEELANKFTLEHLKTYNMEGGVPVAPEGRDSSYALFGDKYSNFNAGKILLILEGIGGLIVFLAG